MKGGFYMDLVTVEKYRGHFNILDPKEDQIKYIFRGIPKEVSDWCSFTLEDEYNYDLDIPEGDYLPIDFAYDLLNVYDKFLFHSAKRYLMQIKEYLANNKEEQEKLWYNNYLLSLEKEVEKCQKKLMSLQKEINRIKP